MLILWISTIIKSVSEWSAFLLCVVRVDWGNVGWLVVRGIWFAVSAGGGGL